MQTVKTISLIHYRKAGELQDFLCQRCRVGEWEGLSIVDLSKRFAVSESVLTRAFRQRYGTSIHAFIIARKMSFAKSRLLIDEIAVKEIAFLAGYTSLSNFSRDFARATGMSPVAWRNCTVCHGEVVMDS